MPYLEKETRGRKIMKGPFLFLDQSLSSTGVARWYDGDVISTTWPLCEGIESRAIGYRELWHQLDQMEKMIHVGQIVHESPAFGAVNKGQAQLLATVGLVAVIELFAISRGLPKPISYAPATWRKTFFSKIERQLIAAKPQRLRDWKRPAILRARQYGFDPVTSDEAEAIGIMDHHLLKLKITPPWREDAIDILESLA